MLAKGTHIVSTKDEERCYKMCHCCECGCVERCTPSGDFYSTKDHGDDLLCRRCFASYSGACV